MSKFNRKPRRTATLTALQEVYKRYVRMGFSEQEARFKALNHHSMKK